MQENFHNRVMVTIYKEPELLDRYIASNKIIFKEKDPPIIHIHCNTRVDVIFVCHFESKCEIEIVAVEIKTGSMPNVGKGLVQLQNTKNDFSNYWMQWFVEKNLFKRLTPFSDYQVFLSLLLLGEKFTKPIEEWVMYKRRFKIANIKRQENLF